MSMLWNEIRLVQVRSRMAGAIQRATDIRVNSWFAGKWAETTPLSANNNADNLARSRSKSARIWGNGGDEGIKASTKSDSSIKNAGRPVNS